MVVSFLLVFSSFVQIASFASFWGGFSIVNSSRQVVIGAMQLTNIQKLSKQLHFCPKIVLYLAPFAPAIDLATTTPSEKESNMLFLRQKFRLGIVAKRAYLTSY